MGYGRSLIIKSMLSTQNSNLDHLELDNLTTIFVDLMQAEKTCDFIQIIKNNQFISQLEINSFISESNFLFLTSRDKLRLINIDHLGFNYEIDPSLRLLFISILEKIHDAKTIALMAINNTKRKKKPATLAGYNIQA